MIPAWITLDGAKLAAAFIVGALACSPLAYCTGKSDGKSQERTRMKLEAQKVETAAAKAEIAATAIDVMRRSKDAEEIKEVRDAVDKAANDDATSAGVSSALAELRRQQAARRAEAAR